MVTANEGEGAAAAPSDIPANAAPRQRTVAGKPRGTITRLARGALAPDKAAKKTRAKRTPTTGTKRAYTRKATGLAGTTAGNQGSLVSSILSQNGFTDGAKVIVTEGRKTLSLPLGLFTGK